MVHLVNLIGRFFRPIKSSKRLITRQTRHLSNIKIDFNDRRRKKFLHDRWISFESSYLIEFHSDAQKIDRRKHQTVTSSRCLFVFTFVLLLFFVIQQNRVRRRKSILLIDCFSWISLSLVCRDDSEVHQSFTVKWFSMAIGEPIWALFQVFQGFRVYRNDFKSIVDSNQSSWNRYLIRVNVCLHLCVNFFHWILLLVLAKEWKESLEEKKRRYCYYPLNIHQWFKVRSKKRIFLFVSKMKLPLCSKVSSVSDSIGPRIEPMKRCQVVNLPLSLCLFSFTLLPFLCFVSCHAHEMTTPRVQFDFDSLSFSINRIN